MTFLELQNALLPAGVGNTARFKETQRLEVKNWLNDRYAEVWGLEDWTFRYASSPFSVTAGSNLGNWTGTGNLIKDIGIVNHLFQADGTRVTYVDPATYFERHLGNTAAGSPSVFTIVNTAGFPATRQIMLDPTPDTSSAAWQILYERQMTPLTVDTETPLLPVEHHYMLVHGAEATGQIRVSDFTYQFSEQRWQNQLAAMKRNYLADQRGEPGQWGSVWSS